MEPSAGRWWARVEANSSHLLDQAGIASTLRSPTPCDQGRLSLVVWYQCPAGLTSPGPIPFGRRARRSVPAWDQCPYGRPTAQATLVPCPIRMLPSTTDRPPLSNPPGPRPRRPALEREREHRLHPHSLLISYTMVLSASWCGDPRRRRRPPLPPRRPSPRRIHGHRAKHPGRPRRSRT